MEPSKTGMGMLAVAIIVLALSIWELKGRVSALEINAKQPPAASASAKP